MFVYDASRVYHASLALRGNIGVFSIDGQESQQPKPVLKAEKVEE